jgi:hypothetical protein
MTSRHISHGVASRHHTRRSPISFCSDLVLGLAHPYSCPHFFAFSSVFGLKARSGRTPSAGSTPVRVGLIGGREPSTGVQTPGDYPLVTVGNSSHLQLTHIHLHTWPSCSCRMCSSDRAPIGPVATAGWYGVRRQSGAATALLFFQPALSKAVSRCACHRIP